MEPKECPLPVIKTRSPVIEAIMIEGIIVCIAGDYASPVYLGVIELWRRSRFETEDIAVCDFRARRQFPVTSSFLLGSQTGQVVSTARVHATDKYSDLKILSGGGH